MQEKTEEWKAAAIQMLRVYFRQESPFTHKHLRDNKTGLMSRRSLEANSEMVQRIWRRKCLS